MKLNDMNMIITGANGSLASGLISYFSEKSSSVVGTVRNLNQATKNANGSIIIEMDPLDHYSIENAINWTNHNIGNIHVWLNVIGSFIMGNHIEEGSEGWNYMYNTNFITTLNCCQIILPKMKQIGWGRIINMGAQTAIKGMPLMGPYCTSKSAVHTLTKVIGLENAGGNITCNAILPGIINTKQNLQLMPDANHKNWTSPLKIAKKIESLILSPNNGQLIEV